MDIAGRREEPRFLQKAFLIPFYKMLFHCEKIGLAGIVLLLFIFILPSPHLVFSQFSAHYEPDYKEVFGKDYEYALKTIENGRWMTDTLENDGFDPNFALAIIFPELIRYSSLIDYIQVKGLEVLYVQYGMDYADFSIGLFQMKPSFAKRIEVDLLKNSLIDKYTSLSALKPDSSETIEIRKERIIRLKNDYYQLLYLEAFICIMDNLHQELAKIAPTDKLIFYSTAYNTGYFKDSPVIMDEMTRKSFYQGLDSKSVKYSYSDISLWYYISRKER